MCRRTCRGGGDRDARATSRMTVDTSRAGLPAGVQPALAADRARRGAYRPGAGADGGARRLQVTVVDPRRAFATDSRFPDVAMNGDWPDEAMTALAPDRRTAVVALTHDPKLDDPGLDVALRSEAFYIAALGSRRHACGPARAAAGAGPRRGGDRWRDPWPGGPRHRCGEPGRDRDLGHGRDDPGATGRRLSFQLLVHG